MNIKFMFPKNVVTRASSGIVRHTEGVPQTETLFFKKYINKCKPSLIIPKDS